MKNLNEFLKESSIDEDTKYILLKNDTIKVNGHTLYRIQAVKDFSDVKKGDIGGYIESEENLSHENDCWVYDDAKVYGNAEVYGSASITENAEVYGDAKVDYNVSGDTKVNK